MGPVNGSRSKIYPHAQEANQQNIGYQSAHAHLALGLARQWPRALVGIDGAAQDGGAAGEGSGNKPEGNELSNFIHAKVEIGGLG